MHIFGLCICESICVLKCASILVHVHVEVRGQLQSPSSGASFNKLFIRFVLIFISVCECVCMYATCMPLHSIQEKALDSRDLELQVFVKTQQWYWEPNLSTP